MSANNQIFISYKSEERDLAIKVRDQLRAWGYQVWLDFERITSGRYFRDAIDEGLKSSQVVIGILTKRALQSKEVKWEWEYAINHSRLIPLRYEPLDNLPYHIASTQYIDCWDDENAAFAKLQYELGTPSLERIEIPTPPPAKPMIMDERQAMLQAVSDMWLAGFLKPTLQEDGAFDIPITLSPNQVLRHTDYGVYDIPDNLDILTLFDDMRRQLLLLGNPGAGKTILLLQLAEKLIAEAHHDSKQPIPVVLNLSSWAANPKQSLATWLGHTLPTLYGINEKLARNWLENDRFLLLLDGLDEVALQYRDSCVVAINEFRRQYPAIDMAICSRIKDYEALTEQLDLRGALLLQDLTEEQIEGYIAAPAYDGLRDAMQQDATLRSLAKVPFMLNVMHTVYKQVKTQKLLLPQHGQHDAAIIARRDDMLERYVTERLQTQHHATYTNKQIRHYLTWIAHQLTSREQIVFQVEGLQPCWLVGSPYKVLYHALVGAILAVSFGGLTGAVFMLVLGIGFNIVVGLLLGCLVGLTFGIIFSLLEDQIMPQEQLHIRMSGSQFLSLIKSVVMYGVSFGGLFAILSGFMDATIVTGDSIRDGIIFGGLIGGMGGVVLGIMDTILVASTLSYKVTINQGIYASFKSGLLSGVVLGICFGVLLGLLLFIVFDVFFGLFFGFASGLALGGLFGGGTAVSLHVALRMALYRAGVAPRNYADFLIHCSDDLLLLRRVGGAFVFRHRYLLEYFAAQYRPHDYGYRD